MAKFSNHKISVEELLELIPDELLDKISETSSVDYQVKKLFGKNMFYLLLYGYLESTKVSLRELEDIYSSQKFQFLFNIDSKDGIKYNSLSDRLAAMNPDYFKTIYQYIYSKFTDLYTEPEALKYSITRVDSTMVAEAANKLEHGMYSKNQHGKKKQIKYTMLMTDVFPSGVEVFTKQTEHNENMTIPAVISKAINKNSIFVFDRGVTKREAFSDMVKNEISFVVRLSPKSRYEVVSSNKVLVKRHKNLQIISDQMVTLFNKKGKKTGSLRLVITKQTNKKKEEIFFLTNCTELEVTEVIDIYGKRWDIEVFFRFIKQELNFSHFLSTNKNGIQIVLYITLILAILLLVYKKLNDIGYKTAVRRFRIELDEMIMKMTIIFAGGDPNLVFR